MGLSTFLTDNPVQLRGLMWLALSDLGQVGTVTITSDSGGGGTASWSYGGTVVCRIDPMTSRRDGPREIGGRIDERSTHVVTVPPGTSVSAADRFAITGRGTFEVTATHFRTGEMASMFEVIPIS